MVSDETTSPFHLRAAWGHRLARTCAALATGTLLVLAATGQGADASVPFPVVKWANPNQSFVFSGTAWPFVDLRFRLAIDNADDEWRNRTDWNPVRIGSGSSNGIYWGQSNEHGDLPPTIFSTKRAHTVLRTLGNLITETDIQFNSIPSGTWTDRLVEGVAAHEFGHTGGLAHDPQFPCDIEINPATMCTAQNAARTETFRTLELRDINDVNSIY